MGVIDDPMLALIARFVVEDIDELGIPDEVFLQQQVDEIKRYVGDATGKKRHQLSLQWIREHAENYRGEWQKRELSRLVLEKRCTELPTCAPPPEQALLYYPQPLGFPPEGIPHRPDQFGKIRRGNPGSAESGKG